MCDIICTSEAITPTLSHQTPVFMMSHPLRAWHLNHCIRHRTHCISVITNTTDIITTFVWHHNHYKCDMICTLYNLISTPYVTPLLYLWHHSLYIWSHIQYVGQHIHYTCDITATNRCHHSHSIENITHTLYCITLAICLASFALYKTSHPRFMISSHHFLWHHTHYIWQHYRHSVLHHILHIFGIFCTIQDITSSLYDIKPPFLWHHTHYIWHHIYCICVITSTVLMISQQLNFWDLIRYIWWHHIHCIWHHSHWMCVISPTFSMIYHPLYVGHHTHYMYNIIYTE